MGALWFRARDYGWSWTPVSTEGWLTVAIFLLAVLGGTLLFRYRLRAGANVRRATVLFILWLGRADGGIDNDCLVDRRGAALAVGLAGPVN